MIATSSSSASAASPADAPRSAVCQQEIKSVSRSPRRSKRPLARIIPSTTTRMANPHRRREADGAFNGAADGLNSLAVRKYFMVCTLSRAVARFRTKVAARLVRARESAALSRRSGRSIPIDASSRRAFAGLPASLAASAIAARDVSMGEMTRRFFVWPISRWVSRPDRAVLLAQHLPETFVGTKQRTLPRTEQRSMHSSYTARFVRIGTSRARSLAPASANDRG